MPGKHLYEYALIRVVPVLERGEFINAGIILFCKRAKYLAVRLSLNGERLAAFRSDLDPDQLAGSLRAFALIAAADPTAGPIARLEADERFRWLTAVRSSGIQTSRPHPGFCDDLDATVERLFRELVL